MSEQSRIAVNWYDRNPKRIANQFLVTVGAHGATQRLAYTCPKDRLALIELLHLNICRVTVGTADGLVEDYWIYESLKNDMSKRILQANFALKEVGEQDSANGRILLFSEDAIKAYSKDASTGGSVSHVLAYKGVEFDPYPIEYDRFAQDFPLKPDIQEPNNHKGIGEEISDFFAGLFGGSKDKM